VPDPVTVEVDWLLRERVGDRSARLFLESLLDGEHERAPLTADLFRRAVEIDRRHGALRLGLVDAAVMAVAELLNAAILTFDFADFRAATGSSGRAWRLVVEESDYARWRRRSRR
jgi:uncharacterized protein